MANTKISALTSASTPLAGTEVLPIVQSSATVKVATNDLTVRNIRANATTGILQVTGPAAASTRVMTTPDANFTVARTDAAQSFTGDQTLSTGNLVIGTSGKGIDFSVTPGTGSSELFADYEEGTFTATYQTSGTAATITYLTQAGRYTKIGRAVFFTIEITSLSRVGGTGDLSIAGLPFTIAERYSCNAYSSYWNNWTTAAPITGVGFVGGTSMDLYSDNANTTPSVPIANLTNGGVYLYLSGSYLT
jgi:hypothetical protein